MIDRKGAIGAALTGLAMLGGGIMAEQARADDDFLDSWFAMVTATQAEQPHWMTPLVTVTPRLEQEFRYDQYFESLPNGADLTNFGAGKGLEIIPSENTEVIFGLPPFEERTAAPKSPAVGAFGDWPALLVKYRMLSANEESGNYILTAFLQAGIPTGAAAFTTNAYVVQPTIAFGAGWQDFDAQATLSEQNPIGTNKAENTFGHPVLVNVATQYHLWDVLWPELEANYTWYPDGAKEGKSQVFLTPGIIFGRFPIAGRAKLIFGVGYQFAVSPHTPSYDNNWILTVRTAF